jgi:hypothetical protein
VGLTLCVWLETIVGSPHRRSQWYLEDFHLQVTSEATTARLVALARNAPCLAHKKIGAEAPVTNDASSTHYIFAERIEFSESVYNRN